MNNQLFDTTPTWEEVASNLHRRAKDIERLMTAMYYRFQYEKVDATDVTAIADEYFRRARWPRPTNLAATANHCASKGWLSEAGKDARRKIWRITQRGYDHVAPMFSSHEN